MGVKKVVRVEGTTQTDGPLIVPVGTSVLLKALRDPGDAMVEQTGPFPADWPKWSFKKSTDVNDQQLESQTGSRQIPFSQTKPGAYKVKAECGSSNGEIEVTFFSVEIHYPHGDPTVSATSTAWNNRLSDGANKSNELTFTETASPECPVPCEARILPVSAIDAIAPRLTWDITDIGEIQATWSQHVEGNSTTGQGWQITATYLSPDGLPSNNSDFGAKTVTLFLDGESIDTANIEVFYLKDERNHPGTNMTPPGEVGISRAPNWFYYWHQALEAGNNVYYNQKIGTTVMAKVPAMKDWSYDKAYNKNEIWIHYVSKADTRPSAIRTDRTGIDLFANALLHEAVHVDQIQRADSLLDQNGQGDTKWEHGWSWNKTPRNHYNVRPGGRRNWIYLDSNNNDLPDGWLTDSDNTDSDNSVEPEARAAETVSENTHWMLDWGNPGKQHMTNQDYRN